MRSRGGRQKFREGRERVAYIGATRDIRVHEFTQQVAVTKTRLLGELSVLGSILGRASGEAVDLLQAILRERRMRTRRGRVIARSGPAMGAKDPIDVSRTGKGKTIRILTDLDAIEVVKQT